MIEHGGLPTQQEQNRQAFLRYLPKRIADFERRILRYRFAGWDPKGMGVLAGDAQRLADASATYDLTDTRAALLALAQRVGEHVASMRAPDPKQVEGLFALLGAVLRSLSKPAPTAGTAASDEMQITADPIAADSVAAAPTTIETGTAQSEAPAPAAETCATESTHPAATQTDAAAHATAQSDDAPLAIAPTVEADTAPPTQEFSPSVEPASIQSAAVAPTPIETAPAATGADSPTESVATSQSAADETGTDSATNVPMSDASPTIDETATPPPPAPVEAAPPPPPAGEPAPASEMPASATDFDAIDEPEAVGASGMRRIFHLSDENDFARALGERLEADGHAIEQVADIDELSELLTCMIPHMLLVDASHMARLAIIGALRRDAQQRSQPPRHIRMVVLAAHDDLDVRRAAHRAGADLLLFSPFDLDTVADRLEALYAPADAEPVRVLIVDDQRADALFAQAVLERAGMHARIEHDPLRVAQALANERTDLVLMDLHMPLANGVEVTMALRADPQFARIPVVFLSGESDPDSQLEAINAGGDDFLFKPIRPRSLIEAVQDRVRRLHGSLARTPTDAPGPRNQPAVPEFASR